MKNKNYLLFILGLLVTTIAYPQGGGAGTTVDLVITSAGLTAGSSTQRTNKLYIPVNYDSNTPSGLIVNYHGTTMSPQSEQQMCQMDGFADAKNYLVVYPEGLVQPNSGNATAWNVLGTQQEFLDTDYIFSNDLLDLIESQYNIDLCKIYATGFSIGGYMVQAVGCHMSDRFAAIAPHSGNRPPYFANACSPTHPTPTLIVHGDSDGTVAFNQADVDYWVGYDNCSTSPTSSTLPSGCQTQNQANVAYDEYLTGDMGSIVGRYIILGGAHDWHGDASCTMVDFFDKFCLDELKGQASCCAVACTNPTISSQPSNSTICESLNTTFSVLPDDVSYTYQWQVSTGGGFTNISNGAPYSGATTADLTITSATTGLDTYQYQVIITDGSCSTTSTAATVTVNATPATPTASSNTPVCETTSIDLTSTTVGSATYDWTGPNAFSSSTQNPSITNATTAMAGTYSVIATENGCTSVVATTDVVVNTNSAPLVDIALTTGSNPTCSGQSLTFTATPTNGGTTPAYQWMVDGGNVGTDSPTFTTTTLTDGQAVTCTMTSNSACASPAATTSNTITINVGTSVTPAISVALTTGSNPTCSSESLSFTATPTNGGTTPAYQWMVDGANVGTDSPTFTTTTLTDGQVVSCTLTSNDACANPTTATSNSVTITVTSSASPAVNIAITNGGNPTCSGQSITFTATPSNGGATPAYQWMVDGGNVGTDSPTFTTTTLTDGQITSCAITSSSSCASPTTATSNSITITVSGTPITPSVSIAINSGTNPSCSGQSLTFIATPVNEGSAPTYQWMVNGGNTGTNSPVFTTTTLTDGQVVSCVMTSNDPCANPTTATSNDITISVTTTVTPTISIALTSGSNPTCPGQSLGFTATITNEGTTPQYQWRVDGNSVGTDSPNFTSTSLTNGQVVSCLLTSSEVCTSQASVTSNPITISTPTNTTPSVSIALTNGSNPSCINESLTFTATPSNGGSSPSYQWTVDGANVGTDATTYTSSTLTSGQVVNCTITSSSSCGNTSSATATGITILVNPIVSPSINVSITAGGNPIVIGQSITFMATSTNGGSSPIYQWKVNNANVGANSATFTSASLSFGDVVSCFLTSNANCTSSNNVTSNSVTVEPGASIDITQIRPVNTKYAKIVSTVSNEYGATITSQGVVWSLTPNPNINVSNVVPYDGIIGAGEFIDTIGILTIETMYYVRSYVTTSNGNTAYSNEEIYYSPPVRTCTPDESVSIDTLGIYPKSLPERENGDLAVDQTFTYAIPFRHTNEKGEVEEIDSIRLDDIVGLPAGLTYDCGRPICIFYPGELGCFTLSGTLPAEDFTSYEMEFEITKYGFARDVSVNGTYYGDQNLDTYLGSYGVGTFTFYVGIEAPVEPGEEDLTGIEGNSSSQLQIVHCSPNPFNHDVNIKFITPTSGNVNFSITDLYGRQLFNSSIDAIVGENSVKYSLDELAEGTYYFTIDNGTNKVTKMMVAIE